MFKINTVSADKTDNIESRLVKDAEAIVLVEELVLTSGRLTKCAATATPEFISVGTVEAGTDQKVQVKKVYEDEEHGTTFAADGSSLNVGDSVTIHTDGAQVTATTTDGVFYITKIIGDGTSGTKVLGMFRR